MGSINLPKNTLALTVFTRADGSQIRFEAKESWMIPLVRSIAKESKKQDKNVSYFERINGKPLNIEP